MNSTDFISIYPPIKRYLTLNQIKVSIFELKLYEYVKISVIIYDQDGVPRDNRFFTLAGDEYMAWGSDDKYIIDYVRAKLNEEGQN